MYTGEPVGLWNNVLHRSETSELHLKEKCKCMVPFITHFGYGNDSEAVEYAFVCELVSCKCLCVCVQNV